MEKNPNRSSNFELGKRKIITEIHVSSFCEEKTYEAKLLLIMVLRNQQ